ncbi:hypothetical protein O1W69_05105 [Chlamydia sp. 12-01]|uniref:hypothetical protein n=1 Tax=Chlamydia sp. 12-01 TaxID=3002742 RepID=UPI0035D51E8B
MFINTYNNNDEFHNATQNYPKIFKLGFVRDDSSLISWKYECCFSPDPEDFFDLDGFGTQMLRALPIIGTIMGMGRIYSAWSTNARSDRLKDKITHTLVGLIEICGLGIVTLIMKIFHFILGTLLAIIIPPCVRLITKDSNTAEQVENAILNVFILDY